jgi:hypothetical protein
VIDQVKYQGHGQRHRDSLAVARLLFTSNFDGELDSYLEQLQSGLGEDADAVWGHCRGYPGRGAGFASWMKAHQIEAALFFAAYGGQTLEQVRANLDKRARAIAFALEAQGLEPEALKARFMEAF